MKNLSANILTLSVSLTLLTACFGKTVENTLTNAYEEESQYYTLEADIADGARGQALYDQFLLWTGSFLVAVADIDRLENGVDGNGNRAENRAEENAAQIAELKIYADNVLTRPSLEVLVAEWDYDDAAAAARDVQAALGRLRSQYFGIFDSAPPATTFEVVLTVDSDLYNTRPGCIRRFAEFGGRIGDIFCVDWARDTQYFCREQMDLDCVDQVIEDYLMRDGCTWDYPTGEWLYDAAGNPVTEVTIPGRNRNLFIDGDAYYSASPISQCFSAEPVFIDDYNTTERDADRGYE